MRSVPVATGNHEADATGRVTGRVPDLELEASKIYGLSMAQHQPRFRGRIHLQTEELCL
jgi:hypothetical protein